MLAYNKEVRENCLPFSCGVNDLDDFFLNDADLYAEELLEYLDEAKTHKFYGEKPIRRRERPHHPMENDNSLPETIRGKHFESWTDLAGALGYHE